MTRTWLAVSILIAMLLGCMTITFLVDKHTQEATQYLQNAWNAAENKDFKSALKWSEKAIDHWKGQDSFLSSFLRHEDSGAVEMELQQLKSFAQSQSAESFCATCAQLIAQMEHIRNNERALLRNIL